LLHASQSDQLERLHLLLLLLLKSKF
jgi:hypothetical protein